MKLLLKKNKLKNLSKSNTLQFNHTPKIAGGFDLTAGGCMSNKCRISIEICPVSEVGDCHTKDLDCVIVTLVTCKC
ncbi:hypothetical protein [Pseudoalteromonas luteoviolacea]|uniref:Uncharacterized protein n=1 Tax=Pseudoalteromonas luteoviolacea NCIMB 1942 TaxID=1365253 RepID=A0A166Z0C3_9GAMM|nr:hypothetical protein [Pseudoalteromonas luteoviolacea]KZN43687.1 hypothetical protein N482_03310 [Pseudoalteromonas luteoviolacea NCIMB 1942]KZX01760.1 hypothetical protein JL49_03880 [Pseudoalteromonas luteoviolacea]